jgi:flagellar hook assembly protein FlgD
MNTDALGAIGTSSTSSTKNAASALGGDDFFQLLIAQLVNQDPLEPTSNQELLNQISSIREIELNTNLSTTLESLGKQQRYSSGGSFVGQYVTGKDADGNAVAGKISAVRFDGQGGVKLELEDGAQLALDGVESVVSPLQAAEQLKGKVVVGTNRSDPSSPRSVEGLVMEVKTDSAGKITLELDSGETLSFDDVLAVEEDEPVEAE